jgi:hypothetical protein
MSAIATANVPLVRNEHGAVLGVDFRRTELAKVQAPGRMLARHVMPGDTILAAGQEVVVHTLRPVVGDGRYVLARTAGGCEIVLELAGTDMVDVVAVGAFDR